ncbi:MAG: class I SAM-dependent methyltransferase [Candidatus Thermoplasmatota archaeon]|nr:class I SAM-dependent methyltransferase [Candidatus Thermoplasmatota archaeon]
MSSLVIEPEVQSEIKHVCHVCGSESLQLFPRYSRFCRVTSDCKPWSRGGNLALCQSCGCVQKLADTIWGAETAAIYDSYSIYHQSGGNEQVVFNQISGIPASRSSKIIQCLSQETQLPLNGKHLDIGCGNGALLRQFHDQFPEWTLFAIELNDKYKDIVESIPCVQKMYVSDNLEHIEAPFDCITMVHVLEHILNPRSYLKKVHNILSPEGILIIEVPNFIKNPYDLIIVDHCTHFDINSLESLLKVTGFEVIYSSIKCVAKELTVIARKNTNLNLKIDSIDIHKTSDFVNRCIKWLDSNIHTSFDFGSKHYFGIFGTSISATWLFAENPKIVSFFVDEDPNRIGKQHLGLPIYSPKHIPRDSVVFLPFCFAQSKKIKQRLEVLNNDAKFIL